MKTKYKTRSSRNKNYWIERGYNIEDAERMAKSRMPGTFEYYTIFKKLSDEEATKLVKEFKENKKYTKDNLIKKYGEVNGIERWESYCEKQRISNTFDYKREKHGWTKKEFDEYNKSRSVTLDNLLKRHGEVLGREKWNNYVNRQSITKSYDYVVRKYGVDEWNRICSAKKHTYDSYLKKYKCVEIATEKYNEFLKKHSAVIPNSRIADDMFSNIVQNLIETNYKQYYCAIHNQEWYINIKNYKCIFLDFFLRDTGKVIEFFGDYWHANPQKYKSGTFINHRSPGLKLVDDVWKDDKLRLDYIRKVPYITDVKIVWENDYIKNPKNTIEDCMKFLNS